MDSARILFVDGQPSTCARVMMRLPDAGQRVWLVDDTISCLDAMRTFRPTLVVLHEHGVGRAADQELILGQASKQSTATLFVGSPPLGATPDYVVPARASDDEIVVVLDELLGAPLPTLRRRAKARTPGWTSTPAQWLRFDITERKVEVDGTPADLGERDYDVLFVLAQRADTLVGYEELFETAFPPRSTTWNARKVTRESVSRIRRKLSTVSPGSGDRIELVRGMGYRLRSSATGR